MFEYLFLLILIIICWGEGGGGTLQKRPLSPLPRPNSNSLQCSSRNNFLLLFFFYKGSFCKNIHRTSFKILYDQNSRFWIQCWRLQKRSLRPNIITYHYVQLAQLLNKGSFCQTFIILHLVSTVTRSDSGKRPQQLN